MVDGDVGAAAGVAGGESVDVSVEMAEYFVSQRVDEAARRARRFKVQAELPGARLREREIALDRRQAGLVGVGDVALRADGLLDGF